MKHVLDYSIINSIFGIMNQLQRIIVLLSVAALVFVSCRPVSKFHVATMLDEIETYINERPDSALSKLQGMDTLVFSSRALRARYSLLNTMARAKNYLDITVPGLIDDASNWYYLHGTADEKLKMLYYKGCIAQVQMDQNGAAVSFVQAEQFVDKAKDKHAVGLLYEAMASVYGAVYNTDKQQYYVEKALSVYKQNSDPLYESFLGDLAYVYHIREDWSRADSLFKIAIANSEAYPHALIGYLSDYARMKVHQPDKDPDGTISLLDRKRALSGALTIQEAGAYAYALALTGRQSIAESLRNELDSLSGFSRYDALPWLVRISELSGDYETAYQLKTELHLSEKSLISETLADTVTQSLREYYEETAYAEKERRLLFMLWALGVVVLLLFFSLFLLLRDRQVRVERDRLLKIRAELEQELQALEIRTVTVADDASDRLNALRIQLRQERLERFRKSGKYGYHIWMRQQGRSSDASIIKALRKDIWEVCALENDTCMLARRLNMDLDGIVSQLKADLNIPDQSTEERFLCYWLVDLKPDMIAELLNISINNVYVKSHRLEKRIRSLNKPEYAYLLHH